MISCTAGVPIFLDDSAACGEPIAGSARPLRAGDRCDDPGASGFRKVWLRRALPAAAEGGRGTSGVLLTVDDAVRGLGGTGSTP